MLALTMIVFFVLSLFWSSSAALNLSDVCHCKYDAYNNEMKHIADCTFRKLTTSNISLLETLPDEIEVLVLRGNNLPLLPSNLFGSGKNFTNLQIIDMSNNNIKNIKGKTFHHVPNVERLILDHNSISLSSHPRMFSNLENLKELHLTDAFLDHELPNLASQLHDVFINSSMFKLEKLHLEQNEIRNFSDVSVFCGLKNLLDLHLGDNNLTGVHFHIDCLPHLRFIDLEKNSIRILPKDQLAKFDALPGRNQSLTIDISNNSIICDCETDLFAWLKITKVIVRENSSIRCQYFGTQPRNMLLKDFHNSFCTVSHRLANLIILAILCTLIMLLFYISARYSVDYFKHSGVNSGKVHYVVIQNFDENRDVNV